MVDSSYSAVIQQDGQWWIGWIEEIPGVNSQGATREELIKNRREALSEAVELNREDAREAAGASYEEIAIRCHANRKVAVTLRRDEPGTGPHG